MAAVASYSELVARFDALSLEDQAQLLLSNRRAVQEFDPIFWTELQEAHRGPMPRKPPTAALLQTQHLEPQPQPEPEPMEVIEAPTSNGSTPPVVEEPKPKRKRTQRPPDQCPTRLEGRLDALVWDVLHMELEEPIPAPPAPAPVEVVVSEPKPKPKPVATVAPPAPVVEAPAPAVVPITVPAGVGGEVSITIQIRFDRGAASVDPPS